MAIVELVFNQGNVRDVMANAYHEARRAIQGHQRLAVTIAEVSKTREMEKKYHAMIREYARQVRFGKRQYSEDVWKALLVREFEKERERQGNPLRHPGELVLSLDESEKVAIRPQTSRFSVSEGRDFIEFLYAEAVEYGIKWPATVDQIVEAVRHERSQRG